MPAVRQTFASSYNPQKGRNEMSIHGKPSNRVEEFAELLERNYGLMLDPGRHKALCAEIAAFFPQKPADQPDEEKKRKPPKREE